MTCAVEGANRDRPGTAQTAKFCPCLCRCVGGPGVTSFVISVVCNMLIAHMDHVDASGNIYSTVHGRKPLTIINHNTYKLKKYTGMRMA